MIKKILLSLLLIIVVAVSGLFIYYQVNKSPEIFIASVVQPGSTQPLQTDPGTLRSTAGGQVIGFADSYDTHAWLGIPYAAPPVGDLRWRAPRAHAGWTGLREATEYGNPCTQFWGVLAAQDGEDGDLLGSEDCLTLNIWAPKRSPEAARSTSNKIPVMVWIHGGGNNSGTANLFQAHNLAGSGEVIVVLINYRLGLMGWFSHDSIRQTSGNAEDASGNYGTLDIIAALKWVNQNIAEFGGDPNNVTIFGESAGGRNVYSMLASPLAKGLFHKAISQSGSADTTLQTLAEDFADHKLLHPISGLRNSSNELISLVLQQQFPGETKEQIRARLSNMPAARLLQMMRSVNAKQLMQMASDNLGQKGYVKSARIIRDGQVIPKESLLELFKRPGSYNQVPLMLGSNRDEQKVFMARNPEYVSLLFGVLPRIKDVERYNRVSKYVTDNWKAGAVDEPAKRISAGEAPPVYAYRFDWDEEPSDWLADLPTLLGAAHGFEISFVFGDFQGGIPMDVILTRQNAAGREELSKAMMDYWVEFAYNGNPGKGRSGQQSDWHAWQNAGDNIMLLDTSADGGRRMEEVRDNVADIKARIPVDTILTSQSDRCRAYATLFLHGYQASDFWSPDEYKSLGCEDYPAGSFRNS
ncbi:MAG: carboxylesterase family protein [Pseudomonadota bacterium]